MKLHQDASDHEEAAQPVARRRLGAVKRTVTLVAVLFTAFHVFATFLCIAPSSPLRDVVPGNALQSYMIPMFGQSWSVFAPEPINGDYRLQIRSEEHTSELQSRGHLVCR